MLKKEIVLDDLSEIATLLKVADRVCVEVKDGKFVAHIFFEGEVQEVQGEKVEEKESLPREDRIVREITDCYIRLIRRSPKGIVNSLHLTRAEIEEKLLTRAGVYTINDLIQLFGRTSIRTFGFHILKTLAETYPDKCKVVKIERGKGRGVWALKVEGGEEKETPLDSKDVPPKEWKSYGKAEYAVVGRKVLLRSPMGKFEIDADALGLPNPCPVGVFKERVNEYLGVELGYAELMALIMALTELDWELKEDGGFRRLCRRT